MLCGRRPFKGASAAETLTAIIREEPEPLSKRGPPIPAPVRWLVDRLLAKEPADRYDSTRDLARELATVRTHLSETTSRNGETTSATPGRTWLRGLAVGSAVVALVAAFLVGRWLSPPRLFHVESLLPSPRIISSARFLPDGRSIVYTAAPDGSDAIALGELFRLSAGGSPVPLGVRDCRVLDVSASGELLLVWDRESIVDGRKKSTPVLARVSAAGGSAPRVLEEEGVHVLDRARWTRGGRDFIVKRFRYKGGATQVIVFQGRPLYEVPWGFALGDFILNDKGDSIGFIEGRATGRSFITLGLDGRVISRTAMNAVSGWSFFPFREHLVVLSVRNEHENPVQLVQLSRSGAFQGVLLNLPIDADVWDISPAGDMLMATGGEPEVQEARWLEPGAERERLLDVGIAFRPALNASGTQLTCSVRKGERDSAILLQAGQSTAADLGEGDVLDQTPDGKTLLSVVSDPDGFLQFCVSCPQERALRGIYREDGFIAGSRSC